jgi:hypothetical protein
MVFAFLRVSVPLWLAAEQKPPQRSKDGYDVGPFDFMRKPENHPDL